MKISEKRTHLWDFFEQEAIKEDAGLDEEGEEYNATENDKEIFKSLFNPQTPSIYDAEWNNMEEKVQMPFIDLLYESRRTPNVMIILKTSMKRTIKFLWS